VVIEDSSVGVVEVDGLGDVYVLAGVEFHDGVVLGQPSVVVAAVSDFQLLTSPSSDALVEVSPSLVDPCGLVELTVHNQVFEPTSAGSLDSNVVNDGSQGVGDSGSGEVEGVLAHSGLELDGDVVDFVVFRGVVEDGGSVPSDVEAQAVVSDEVSAGEGEAEGDGAALGLVRGAGGEAVE